MSIKTHFSIKDLENLSGVKAHTIRIWEKRYHLLNPDRTETNIRIYDLDNLKRLLDITFLYEEGYKISKIAKYDVHEIKNIIANSAGNNHNQFAKTSFKNAMLNFDSNLFNTTYTALLKEMDFQKLFFEVFIPFLEEVGILWHTNTIDISHERFIAELIKRKTILHIENQKGQYKINDKDLVFCLFTPLNEMHDLGLLYTNFELEKANIQTIYLGPNTPLESLPLQLSDTKEVIFISYNTLKPVTEDMYDYFSKYQELTNKKKSATLWVMGPKAKCIDTSKIPENIKPILTFEDFKLSLAQIKNEH
ncbi:MerR family transcriptional regulator [Patiriisocius marinistellae]|uniref:MerR family transcriptional regulator n=1 Tax=Patiriisocius marinistellae TaxID=2494560 RepID=A0A5J4FXD3_9FLAO|nr:MerR family transcriptional regulator [Patiriisocius marinistellae]GEQ86713.1 MerR family transcriptional regulator [Patiriisocius marinistellae]